MSKLKIAKPTKPASVPFTRNEYALLVSLVEQEAQCDLAKTNERYAATLDGIRSRLHSVAYPDAEHWPTDRVTVR